MKNFEIIQPYVTSLLDLREIYKVDLLQELNLLLSIIDSSEDLQKIIFYDLFTEEEKKEVFKGIFEKQNFSELFQHYILFLVEESRIDSIKTIFAFAARRDEKNRGILRAFIVGHEKEISEKNKEKLLKFMVERYKKEPKLRYESSHNITSGYRVSIGDEFLDITLDKQLNDFKKLILS